MYLTHFYDVSYLDVYFTGVQLFFNAPGVTKVGESDDNAVFSSESSYPFQYNAVGYMNANVYGGFADGFMLSSLIGRST